MLLASAMWGWSNKVTQRNNEAQWELWCDSEGFMPCEFQWEEDVYPCEGPWAKGWAKVTPLLGDTLFDNLTRRVYLSCPVQGSLENYFNGVTWRGYIAFKKGQSLRYFKTGYARDWNCGGLFALRRSLIIGLEKNWGSMPSETRGFVRGLLTGNRKEISDSIRQHYTRLGLMALLAISGMNLVLVYGAVLKTIDLYIGMTRGKFKIRWMGSPAFWAMTAVSIYALLGAWTPPVLRAFGMLLLAKCALLLGRRYRSWNVLFFMAWLELWLHPTSWGGASFLLTYFGVAGIFWFGQCWRLKSNRGFLIFMLQLYGISWGAMLWTWPITVMFFGSAPSWAWLFAPLFCVIFSVVMIYALLLAGLSLVVQCPVMLVLPLTYYNRLLEYCSQQGAWVTSVLPSHQAWLIIYYGAMLAYLWTKKEPRKVE